MYRESLNCLWLVITVLCVGRTTCQEDGIENCDCSRDTFSVNGTCYSVNEEMSTYEDANKHCQRLGGHLLKFEPSHNITKFLEYASSKFSNVWIGLDDKDEEGSFRWIADGSELNWNMSNFRSENDEDLDCIGMDSSGDFQFLDCKTNHAATCDLKVCPDGTCNCYRSLFAKSPINLYNGERCILSLQIKAPNFFMEQEATCVKIGFYVNNRLNGSLVILQPWYDIKNIIMEQIQTFPRGKFFWIGLTDMEVEGQVKFRHSDLNILNDTDNDFNAANSDSMDCVSINTKSGQWNYALCSKMLPSICQTEPSCEGTRDETSTPSYTEVTESSSTGTKDFPESHVVMVSMVAGVIGSSLTILAVIIVICVILKYFKASLQRFRRYKMSTIHGTSYTEVQNGNNIEPSNSFANRPRRNPRPLSFAESYSITTDGNEHFYEDSESNGETEQRRTRDLPSIYNGGDSITYEDLDSPTDRPVESKDSTFGERSSRTSNRNGVNTGIKEIVSESRSSRIMLLNDSSHHEGGVTNAAEGVTNLNNCYYEIDSNIYQEVHEMRTADSSYDDVTVEEKEVATPDMTYNEFYDGAGVSDNVTLDMVYNDSYDHGHFEGNTAADYDEI
ncbi:C-type mannose receptor 2 [Holothuria leucospilota]|uniref:C-type mannose receptor 2 n=1 Tax=Holothuria leucospilota TaxID=206669 RepID=A0A9Q1BUU6_HOLLE|nr:C-type mannose receptor 2 [Holothuria leucospilota]